MGDRPIVFNLLRKDELAYEVMIRDAVPEGTVEDLRVQMRTLGKEIDSDNIFSTNLDCKSELAAVREKLNEVTEFLLSPKPAFKSFNRIKAIAYHAYHRLARIEVMKDNVELVAEADKLDALMSRTLSKLDILFTTFTSTFQRDVAIPDVPSPQAFSEPKGTPAVSVSCSKDKEVSRLNLRYNGQSCVRVFLQRIEELSQSRGIPDSVLYQSAIELFSDQALIWYRSMRSEVSSWAQLRQSMLEEFSPIDYDTRLLDEIRQRTQGPTENVSSYLAVMINLFSRLTNQLSDSDQVQIVRYNLRPPLVTALALETINNLQDLKIKGKIVEYNLLRANMFTEPPKLNQATVASDLAYLGNKPKPKPPVDAMQVNSVQESRVCYHCGKAGHPAVACRDRKIYCYRCGKPGVTLRYCDNCNQGNLSKN